MTVLFQKFFEYESRCFVPQLGWFFSVFATQRYRAYSAGIAGRAGVEAPIGGWRDFLGAPNNVMEAWNEIDIRGRIQSMTSLPVEFAKDSMAACVAELVAGQGRRLRNFLYVFIGTFIGRSAI